MKKLEKECEVLNNYLDSTSMNNAEIAKKIGVTPMTISKTRSGQFPTKIIHLFFDSFPELDPSSVYAYHDKDGYSKILTPVKASEIEKENAELSKSLESLRREIKDLRFSNNHLKLSLSSRLSKEEREMINFKMRNQHSMAKQIYVTKNMEKVTLSVTHKAKVAL
jgi:hypothetical protein